MLNNITFGCAKSIAFSKKVISLSSSAHFAACDFIFLFEFTQEKERASRVAQLLRALWTSTVSRIFSCFSRFPLFSFFFFLSLASLAVQRERLDRWMGDDSVQRGVRNFHARMSRRAGQAAPAAHTGETHESTGSLLVATTGGIVYV